MKYTINNKSGKRLAFLRADGQGYFTADPGATLEKVDLAPLAADKIEALDDMGCTVIEVQPKARKIKAKRK